MRWTVLLSTIILVACNNNEPNSSTATADTSKRPPETTEVDKKAKQDSVLPKSYSNKRFKNVTVKRIDNDSFFVRGQGQIFEANFSWIVEDGHEELKKGYQMTDAGAPEWGNFKFGIKIPKKRANSTLTLVLFESSAKDGSRQHELPIILY